MTSWHNDGPDAAGTGGGTTVTLSDADRAETIERLYDVALDPERFEALLDHWESAVAPLRAHVDLSAPRLLDDPQIAAHFRRATAFLDRAARSSRSMYASAPPPVSTSCIAGIVQRASSAASAPGHRYRSGLSSCTASSASPKVHLLYHSPLLFGKSRMWVC